VPEKVIVCFGDSAVDDGFPNASPRWPARLCAGLNAAGAPTYRVIDAESPGLTPEKALALIESRVVFHRPRLVTLRFRGRGSTGTPAAAPTPIAQFEAGIRALGQIIRERTAAIVVFAITPAGLSVLTTDAGAASDPYHDVTRRVAYELNAPLLDLAVGLRRSGEGSDRRRPLEGRLIRECAVELMAEEAVGFLRRLL
jgi:hypothetical protein